MRAARSTGWVLGTVALVLAIFAGTWFLVAGPRFSNASETAAAAQDARDKNDLMAVQVAKLADQFTHLDEYKTELASLRTQIPTQAELSAYVRELDALAAANGVTLMSLSPSVPIAVTPEITAPVATADATTTATGEPTADATATTAPGGVPTADAAAPAAPAALEAFGYIPLSIVVQGPYVNVTTFLTALQTGTPRIFVPTGLDGARLDADSGANPPTAADDLSLTIAGNLYVLLDTTTPAVTPSAAPLPSSDRNPFGSLPGVGG